MTHQWRYAGNHHRSHQAVDTDSWYIVLTARHDEWRHHFD